MLSVVHTHADKQSRVLVIVEWSVEVMVFQQLTDRGVEVCRKYVVR